MFTYVDQNWSNRICRAPADRNNGRKTGDRRPDGTFAPGNPGRPRGARHKTTLAIEEILDGEADVLTRKAVELALEGDTTALRLCLERIAPARKDAPVNFELPPIECAQDASRAAQAVLRAVSEGDITPGEAAAVMALVEAYRKVLETDELESRVAALEANR